MATVDISVLGDLAVVRDGTPVAVTGPGRQALLALLTAHAGRLVPLERIVDELWGDDPPASAVKVVQTYVSQLRRLLEPDHDDWSTLVTHPSGYELAIDSDAVDATRFEAAVEAARELPVVEAVEPLRAALSLWRGRPYTGIDRPFAVAEARRLEQIRASALSRCLAGELERGRHEEVEPELRALVDDDPLDESLTELLMLALYRGGRQAEALHVYDDLRNRLAEELGADPGPGIAELHARILRHDPTLGPDPQTPRPTRGGWLRGPDRRGGNLPRERSRFVGRRQEIREVAEMVGRDRLVTLVGAGGAGKTRLALRVAAEAADEFDGVWLVALATLKDPDQLAGHCLTQLRIIDQMDRAPRDTLRAWIGDRRLLLVLDNCEHLATAVAELADELLAVCPNLHVLATGRQPLHCPGEQQWRVPSLKLPAAPDPGAVAASEAGVLLLDRAGEARPGFELDETTAPAVYQICRRLDGIPLAIELAAVRMATMSPTDLASGLDDRFHLLTSGHRTALPRHQTLRATTDWSYSLLTADQQRLLCRLSTFVADFDVGAAVDVCGYPPLDRRDVPGLLADLVDHSLVEAGDDGGHTRYRLLETVRDYGQERLGAEADDVARRYGDWVARLSESVGENAHIDTAAWYGKLDREFLHLQGAFAAAMRRGDAETALRIAAGCGWALIIIGRFHRQREWLGQALALARDVDVRGRVMARGLLMSGALAGIDHRFDGALGLLDEAGERFSAAGDHAGGLWVGYWRAATLAEMGRLEPALQQIRETADAAADCGLEVVESNARAEQAEVGVAESIARGGPESSALADAATALARARELGEAHEMQELLARVSLSEALLLALDGEPAASLPRCLEHLEAWRRLGRGGRLILGLIATAKVALLAGCPSHAQPLVHEAFGLIGEVAWSGALREALQVAAVLAAPRDREAAAVLLGAADARQPTHRWRMPDGVSGIRAGLEETLGSETFAARHAEGETLSLDDAVARATASVTVPD